MSDPKLRRKLKGRFAEKEDKPKYMPGLLGNGQGVVNTGTDGIVYVRVNEMATTAVCTTLPPVNDLPVWVYKPAFDKARLHVHSQRFYGGADEQIISGTSQHAETHRYFGSGSKGGTDVLYVDPRQIIGIRIFPIENTMTCAVFPWVVLIDGVPKLIGTLEEDGTYTPETLDFSPYLITTEDKSKLMLITLDNTGALVITEGAEVDTDAINIETDTPAIPAGTKIVIGAVRLYYGQYAIQEGRENTDLMDWRWLYYHVHEGGSGELDIGIDGLNDVTITTIGDLNVLQYDSAGGAWVNKTLAEAGINPMTTAGDIIYGGADGVVTRLAIGAVTQVLTVSAGGTSPEWATAAEGFVNPMTTIGDFIYGGTDGEATRLAIGGALEVLRINAAGTGPEWYLSTSFENPMTTIGDIVYGTTDGAVTRLAAGTEAQILAVIGGIPGWTNAGTDIGFSNPMTTIGDIIYGGTDGEAVRLAAGTEAQILAVASGVPAWTNAPGCGDMNNPMTTAGDIIYGTTDGTPARLGVGDDDDVLTLSSGVPTWAAPTGGSGGLYSAYICIHDQKAQNTSGGTFTAGDWRTRDLNTEVADTGNNASIASNQITLAAGTYSCLIFANAFRVDLHRARLYNITDSAVILLSTTNYTKSASQIGDNDKAIIAGRFTIAAEKVLEIQHYCLTTGTTTGFGVASNQAAEIYTIAEFWKEA